MLLLDALVLISFARSLPAVACAMEEMALSHAAREKHSLPRIRAIQMADLKRSVLYLWSREYCTGVPLASQVRLTSFEDCANRRPEMISFISYDEHAVDTVFPVVCCARCGCMERRQRAHTNGFETPHVEGHIHLHVLALRGNKSVSFGAGSDLRADSRWPQQ